MIRVIFVCLGNICRSPMAEFVFKDMVKKEGLEDEFYIESAATSSEEIGNGMHPGTINMLRKMDIPYETRFARQLTYEDYDKFDYLLGMESNNIRSITKITRGDPKNKVYRILDFSKKPRDIADPWYTMNFKVTYEDILEGCNGFLEHIKRNYIIGEEKDE